MENVAKRNPFSVENSMSVWKEREMQLVRLHEELIAQRESLLSCSTAYSHSQDTRARKVLPPPREAISRNQKLMKDIETSYQDVFDALNTSPTPRFMTLQKNYWAMVKSQVPMWEQELGIQGPNVRTGAEGHSMKGHSARSRSRDEKNQRRKQRRASKSPRGA